MKATALVLLTGLCATPLAPARQDPVPQAKETQKKSHPITRFFEEEAERLQKDAEGSWILLDYTDPGAQPLEDAASGFATFHDGFLTLMVATATVEARFLRARERLLLRSGAYRYRFDQQGSLQLSSVVSYSNLDSDDVSREPAGQAFEYYARVEDGLLELRNQDGVTVSFRKLEAGEFPAATIKKLEGRRGGVDRWEKEDEPPPKSK